MDAYPEEARFPVYVLQYKVGSICGAKAPWGRHAHLLSVCLVSILGNDLQGSIRRSKIRETSMNAEGAFHVAPPSLCAHVSVCPWLYHRARCFNSITHIYTVNQIIPTHPYYIYPYHIVAAPRLEWLRVQCLTSNVCSMPLGSDTHSDQRSAALSIPHTEENKQFELFIKGMPPAVGITQPLGYPSPSQSTRELQYKR